MKIHRLKIKNITSLKGDHLIDFQNDSALSGLFAITGDTGSGKSSILTAISLALYGKSYKTTLSAPDFVTLGECEGHIELSFSIKDSFYQAVWDCRVRKKSGERLKTPNTTRKLVQNNLAIEKLPEEVIGLNYSQFCKAVILNQGKFADFLTSSFSTRKDILEKLYDGEMLGLLSKKLNEKIKNKKFEAEKITSTINSTFLFSKEDYSKKKETVLELEGRHSQSEKEVISLSAIVDKLDDLIIFNRKFQNTNEEISKIQEDLKVIIKKKNFLKSNFDKSENSLKKIEGEAKLKIPILTRAIKKIEKIEYLEQKYQEILKIKNAIYLKKKEEEKQEYSIKELIRNLHLKEENILQHPHFFKITKETYLDLQSIIGELTNFNTILKNLEKNLSEKETRKVHLEQKREALKKEEEDNQKHLSFYKDQDYLKKKISLNNEIKDLSLKFLQITEKENKLLDRQKRISKRTQEKDSIDISSKEKELNLLKERLSLIEEKESLNDLKQAINTCISHITTKNSLCPVCGSDDTKHLNPEITKTDNDKDSILKKENIIKSIKKEEIILTENTIHLKRIKNEIDEIKKEELLLIQELKKEKESSLKDPQISLDTFEQRLSTIEEAIQESNKREVNSKNIQKQLTDGEKDNTLLKTRISEEKDALKQINQSIILKITALKKIRPNSPKKIDSILEHFKETGPLLQNFIEINDKIKQQQEQLRSTTRVLFEFSQQIKTRDQESKEMEISLKELKEKLSSLKASKDPMSELEAITQEVNSKRVEKDQSYFKFIEEDKNTERLLGLLELKKGILKESETVLLTTLKNAKEIESSLLRGERKIKDIDPSLLLGSNSFLFKELKKHYEEIKNESKEDFKSLHDQLIELKSDIKNFKNLESKKEKEFKRLSKIEEEIADLSKLYSVIGAEEFTNFALGLLEENLLIQTNYELQSLCSGRYEIKQEDKQRGRQDFYIIDHYKAGEKRKISTLSGGETFLVSLAMALSLAEMTRERTEIDSFFIDEGFGSLDQDGLQEALEVLLTIQSRGKQIGIISHIKALTSQIQSNIHLTKDGLGHSQLEIIRN